MDLPILAPLEIISDVEGGIADVEGAVADVEGAVADTEGSITIAEGIAIQAQQYGWYLMLLPLVLAEFTGLTDVLLGAAEVFIGTVRTLIHVIPDGLDALFTLATFSLSWMMCLFKNISNMQTCLIYYLLEVVGQILYLPFRIFLFLVFQLGVDLYPIEKGFWNFVEDADKFILGITGFHISHYPKNIRDQCYNCQRLKISALERHSANLVNDITVRAPKNLMPGFNLMATGGTQLMHPNFDFALPQIDESVFTDGWSKDIEDIINNK